MVRGKLFISVFSLMVILLILGIQPWNRTAYAQDGGGGRFKLVETTYTQYTWQMYSINEGKLLCTVTITHAGLPSTAEAFYVCGDRLYPPQPTLLPDDATPSAQLTPTPGIASIFNSVYWVLASSKQITQFEKVPIPPMSISITVPQQPVLEPYLTITAFEPAPGYAIKSIQGYLQGRKFECQSPCTVALQGDAQIIYWAVSTLGDETQHFSAILRITVENGEYQIFITTSSDPNWYRDTCTTTWDGWISGFPPAWQSLPQLPDALHTEKTLYYLASQLIQNKVVDASECPSGGVYKGGAVNACGLEAARPTMITWQNRFDPVIWSTAREFGIPAKLIKSLLEQESQFWPGNARQAVLEYGLSQAGEAGADVLLRWDPEVQALVCPGLLFDCSTPYALLPEASQALLRGGVMQWLNAECPTCQYQINLERAEQSVRMTTRFVRANCQQVGYILEKYDAFTSIDDAWRMTLVSYHAGYQCLENAIQEVKKHGQAINWQNLSSYLTACSSAQEYVDSIWQKLSTFVDYQPPVTGPTPMPTSIPIPSATPVSPQQTPMTWLVDGHIYILAYIDLNNNNLVENNERIDGIMAEARFANGKTVSQVVSHGEADLVYTRQMIGSPVVVSLPYLSRSSSVKVPPSGDIFVIFRLESPVFPRVIP
jgi:hypothetical protein